ncbi:MAG: hypothetical protein LQ350_006261 [Teloschistes chrysophthalmus]|nr:MAG: hypothetical protein LQ350_006261 [Niorma chrysophthalma]
MELAPGSRPTPPIATPTGTAGAGTPTATTNPSSHPYAQHLHPLNQEKAIFFLLISMQSLALMGGATSGPAWDAQRRQYCGREAKVTNTATGVSKLLYIGDSFAQPRSAGAIDIVIGAFTELYGKNPQGNHNLVMNNVEWHFTGNVNPKYTVPGNNFGDSGPTTLQTSTTKGSAPVSTPAGCTWGCLGWDCKLKNTHRLGIDTIMTNRYTHSEWRTMIDAAERDLPNNFPEHKAPILGSTDFAKCIDHTLLKLEATKEQIDELCQGARRHDFQSVCVRLNWVERAVQQLSGSNIAVACVVGFPEGTYSMSEKVKEASNAVAAGALELDMVINYPLLKQQKYSQVYTDIAALRNVAPHPVVLKVILETSKLSQFDIIAGCKVAEAANADFVKTSTGFGGQGATVENVRLMKNVIGPHMKVKASGGVKTVNECVAMMEAGAERIGTSNGVWIMKEAQSLLEDVTHAVGGQEKGTSRPSDSLTRMFSSS